MVRIEHLGKTFGRRPAVTDLSMEVRPGEIFGLLGHNGAGKSTTFGMMLGHVRPDHGSVSINGFDVQKQRAQALRRVGAIFETPAFYDYMTGAENLRFLVSLSHAVPESRLLDVVRLVGLEHRINDKVGVYSHGMRQRLALAQALLPDPSFILLDEPTEGLDPAGIHEMRLLIQRLRDEHGLTVMLSSHLLPEVEQLCDRVAILQDSRLVFCGEWKQAQPTWHLDLDDWNRARPVIVASGAILSGTRITLAPGTESADLVAALVRAGVRVNAVERVRMTLEEFYLAHISP